MQAMLNDRSSALSLLRTRRSGKPREMVGPGPSPQEIERILGIAARTPDHGKLFPWRFVTIADDQRDDLALLFRKALAEEDPCAGPAHHEAEAVARPRDRSAFMNEVRPDRTPYVRTGRSLLPDIEPEDESEIIDKVQMSELVVANLNEMIRTLNLPARQVASVEDDLFARDTARDFAKDAADDKTMTVEAPKGRPRQFHIKR